MPYKVCSCGLKSGVRTLRCKCGKEFRKSKNNKIISKEIEDTSPIEVGDVIKVLQGYGPHYYKDSVRQSMGENGTFLVKELHPNGYNVVEFKNGKIRDHVRHFVYMGRRYFDESTKIQYEPHKIIKIKRK